jgi:hypothetical protein
MSKNALIIAPPSCCSRDPGGDGADAAGSNGSREGMQTRYQAILQ